MNKHYIVYNASGEIVKAGQCQPSDFERQAMNPGESVIEIDNMEHVDVARDEVCPITQTVKRGVREPKKIGMAAEPQYLQDRFSLYPTVTEQLDMMWHAMDDGQTPKIEPWYSLIKGIKDACPNPNKAHNYVV